MNNSVKLELPKGHVDEARTSNQEIMVAVSRKGELTLNGKVFAKDQLMHEIKKMAITKKDRVVFIRGDGNAPYKAIAELIDAIKYIAGVEHVVLETEKT